MLDASSVSSRHPQCKEEVTGGKAVRVVINVGGVRNEAYKSTLKSIPGTRLANLVSDTSCETEFFFDRSSAAFTHILNYYRTGKLHCPDDVCGNLFGEELAYWGISETDVEPCCWTNFKRHRDAEEALALLEQDEQPPYYGQGMRKTSEAWRAKTWALFDAPNSSVAARIIGVISMLFILTAVTKQCLESVHQQVIDTAKNITVGNITREEIFPELVGSPEFALVEMICVNWFTFEFLVRIICCPDKQKFFLNIMNIIDFVAILPFYLELCLDGLSSSLLAVLLQCLRAARCIRILRLYKMMPQATGIRALGLALRASLLEFCLLGIALFVALGVYSTLIFYAEVHAQHGTVFRNIFYAFWWAVVTMTTVGYGDMYPETSPGQVVASLCALTGVLSIAMPISILVNNFAKYYALTEAKHRRPAKGRRWEGPDMECKHKEAIK